MNLKKRGYLYIFCLLVLAIGACKNNNDAPSITYQSSLNVVNLVPDVTINFYSNGTRQNNYKLGYSLASGYVTVPTPQTLGVKDTLYNTLYTNPFAFKPDTSYTLFVTGQASKQTVTGILTIDTAASDAGGKAKARFIHASPNAPALDVLFNTVAISNTSYKSVSTFSKVDTGNVTVKVRLAGTNTVVATKQLQLTIGGVYTIYVYGLYNASGTTAFNIGEIINH